jgi:hypothetical protein
MPSVQLTLNLMEGSVSFSFTPQAAREVQTAIVQVMNSIKAKSAKPEPGVRATAQKSMEYQYTGDVFLEIFCNPNIWPTPFAAKALITLRDDRIRLTTEAALSGLMDDITQYLDQVG